MENKKYYASIDIFKFLCAIIIADYHIRLLSIEKSFFCELSRFALYFFHCSCGYFYMTGLKRNSKNLNKNIKRLITPLLFWMSIYFLINIYNEVLIGNKMLNEFMKHQFISLFINGVGFHLWFIAALIVYMIVVSLFYKKKKMKFLYITSIILYIVGLFGSYYYQFGNKIPMLNIIYNFSFFPTIARVFLNGLPLFVMGVYFSENADSVTKVSNSKLILFIFLALSFSIFEIYLMFNYLTVKTNICALGLAILLIPTFIFLINNPMDKYNRISKLLKYLSSFTYYSHPIVNTVAASLLMRVFNVQLDGIYMSILVVILCSIFGYMLYKLDNKHLNRICS